MLIVIYFLNMFFYGIAKGISNAQVFENGETWRNKYKWGDKEKSIPVLAPRSGLYGWYHKKYRLPYRERFLLSATLFVSVTDPFHFWEGVRSKLLILVGLSAYALPAIVPGLELWEILGVAGLSWLAYVSGFHAIYQPTRRRLRR